MGADEGSWLRISRISNMPFLLWKLEGMKKGCEDVSAAFFL